MRKGKNGINNVRVAACPALGDAADPKGGEGILLKMAVRPMKFPGKGRK